LAESHKPNQTKPDQTGTGSDFWNWKSKLDPVLEPEMKPDMVLELEPVFFKIPIFWGEKISGTAG
jgi:hypothetical protein